MRTWILFAALTAVGCSSAATDGGGLESAMLPGDATPDVALRPDATPEATGTADTGPAPSDVPEPATDLAVWDSASAPDGAPEADVSGSPPDTGGTGAPAYSLFIGDWTLTPGQESTRCVVKRLSNTTPFRVRRIHTQLAKGSHHLIIYRTSSQSLQETPTPCSPFASTLSGQTAPLMISEVAEETLELPPGVALEMEANQAIRIEAHYLNYYPEDIVAHGDVTFEGAAPGEDVSQTADLLFYGTTSFSVPAGQSVTTPWKWLDVPNGARVFAITGHTHRFGTNVEVQASNGAAIDGQPLYPGDEPFLWSEAPIVPLTPPLLFEPGMGFRFRCSWTNTSQTGVGFGPSASDEMCFLWAYYYPSVGYRLCTDGGLFGGCPED